MFEFELPDPVSLDFFEYAADDNRILLASESGNLAILDRRMNRLLFNEILSSQINDIKWQSGSSTRFAVAEDMGYISIFKACSIPVIIATEQSPLSLMWNSKNCLVSSHAHLPEDEDDYTDVVRVWDVESATLKGSILKNERVKAMTPSTDKSSFALLSSKIEIYDSPTYSKDTPQDKKMKGRACSQLNFCSTIR
jgi:hypothetical protein